MHNVLVVEDDKRISMALNMRLKAMGYKVNIAADAVYAMNAAIKHRPEVVLLDINLPGGDGFVVADRIRSSMELDDTPIIFISASRDPDLKIKAGNYISSRFIEKPFHASQLTDAIDELCH